MLKKKKPDGLAAVCAAVCVVEEGEDGGGCEERCR